MRWPDIEIVKRDEPPPRNWFEYILLHPVATAVVVLSIGLAISVVVG